MSYYERLNKRLEKTSNIERDYSYGVYHWCNTYRFDNIVCVENSYYTHIKSDIPSIERQAKSYSFYYKNIPIPLSEEDSEKLGESVIEKYAELEKNRIERTLAEL